MKTWMLVLFLAAGPILSAEVITGVTCTVDNSFGGPTSTVTDPYSCSLNSPDQGPLGFPAGASATASASLSLATNPNSFSTLTVDQHADASSGFDDTGIHYLSSGAGSAVSVHEALLTTGSVRSGFVQISATAGSAGDFRGSTGNLDLSFESIAVSCFGSSPNGATCVLWPNGVHTVPGYVLSAYGQDDPFTFPFTLGQAFNLSYSGAAGSSASGGIIYGSANGYANIQFQFRLFEADGVTPVALGAVPEPGTFALFGAALGVLAAVKKGLDANSAFICDSIVSNPNSSSL